MRGEVDLWVLHLWVCGSRNSRYAHIAQLSSHGVPYSNIDDHEYSPISGYKTFVEAMSVPSEALLAETASKTKLRLFNSQHPQLKPSYGCLLRLCSNHIRHLQNPPNTKRQYSALHIYPSAPHQSPLTSNCSQRATPPPPFPPPLHARNSLAHFGFVHATCPACITRSSPGSSSSRSTPSGIGMTCTHLSFMFCPCARFASPTAPFYHPHLHPHVPTRHLPIYPHPHQQTNTSKVKKPE